MTTEKPKSSEQIRELEQFLPEASQEELAEILAYGENMKAEGEREKKEFWQNNDRSHFERLLKYRKKHRKELLGKYKHLDKMSDIEKKKFIEEYLYDDMLYSGQLDYEDNRIKGYTYKYKDLEKGNVILESGTTLDLNNCEIGDELAEAISHIQFEECVDLKLNNIGYKGAEAIAKNLILKDGVCLHLGNNKIGDEGVKIIAENIKLKHGVFLSLNTNKIGDKGAEAISHMQLKEGVCIYLADNEIGKEGAKAIAENLTLKDRTYLNLSGNQIGDDGAKAISHIKMGKGADLDLSKNKIGDEGIKAIAKNLELQEGVELKLHHNNISDEGVKFLVRHLNFKNGVVLFLGGNRISRKMAKKVELIEKLYHIRGIHCQILI